MQMLTADADASLSLILQTPEEVNVCKLLHLIDVNSLGHLFVIIKYPGRLVLARHGFADEGNVMACVNGCTLVADDGFKLEICREVGGAWEFLFDWLRSWWCL